jgi:F-type H+-transporting ATPase subunit b
MQIDWWTLALQAINFLILIWLLGRFLYRPVADIVARRQEAAQVLMDEAATMRDKAEADRNAIAEARKDIAAERTRLLVDARVDAGDENKRLVAEAEAEAARIRREAEADAARLDDAHNRALHARAEELAVMIASRLLERLPPREAQAVFLDGLVASIKTMPPAARAALNSGQDIAILTASPLDDAAQARIGTELEAALGAGLKLTFRTDPVVIAGIELESADLRLRNSWREDLARIREELFSDGG